MNAKCKLNPLENFKTKQCEIDILKIVSSEILNYKSLRYVSRK